MNVNFIFFIYTPLTRQYFIVIMFLAAKVYWWNERLCLWLCMTHSVHVYCHQVARAPDIACYVRPISLHCSLRVWFRELCVTLRESPFPTVHYSSLTTTVTHNYMKSRWLCWHYSQASIILPLLWAHHTSIMPLWQCINQPVWQARHCCLY